MADLAGLVDKYRWVGAIEAWTVAVAECRTTDELLYIYGGDPGQSVGDHTFEQMFPLQSGSDYLRFHVQFVSTEHHVIALENNGWTGALSEIARRCSHGGRSFFSVYWNVNAFGFVTQAIDGTVTAKFESLYPISPAPPQPGDRRPGWAIGSETPTSVVWQTCMALMEQQTGVAIEPDWLTVPRPTYRIPDPHWMLRDVPDADQP